MGKAANAGRAKMSFGLFGYLLKQESCELLCNFTLYFIPASVPRPGKIWIRNLNFAKYNFQG